MADWKPSIYSNVISFIVVTKAGTFVFEIGNISNVYVNIWLVTD